MLLSLGVRANVIYLYNLVLLNLETLNYYTIQQFNTTVAIGAGEMATHMVAHNLL